MTLPRNPFLPANKLDQFDDNRSKTDSIGSQKSTRSGLSLSSLRSLRSQQRTAGVIRIRGIDSDISLKSILAQVRGGAIERVTRFNDTVQLVFVQKNSAETFYKFATLGQFIVEGRVFRPDIPETCQRTHSSEYEKAIQEGARRVLKMSRPIYDTECRLLYSKLNMVRLENVFESIGPIMSVQPMFCQSEVAFLIVFEAIETAIKAKKLFDLKSEFFSLYFGWLLEFSTDPTEQGCYISP